MCASVHANGIGEIGMSVCFVLGIYFYYSSACGPSDSFDGNETNWQKNGMVSPILIAGRSAFTVN